MTLRNASRSKKPPSQGRGSFPVCRFVLCIPGGSQIHDPHTIQEPDGHDPGGARWRESAPLYHHLQENSITGCPEEWQNHHSYRQQGRCNPVCSRFYRLQTAQQGRMDKAKVTGKTRICKAVHFGGRGYKKDTGSPCH